jgi:predicted transcriptional regulator
MEKTTLYLSSELQSILRQLARRTGRAQADLIREALTEYVSRQEHPRPRSLGAGEDADLAARDSEEWLRSDWERVAATGPASGSLPPAGSAPAGSASTRSAQAGSQRPRRGA